MNSHVRVHQHSAQPSSSSGRALLTLSPRPSFASTARISLAGTPDISSTRLRFWHVDTPQNLNPNQNDAARDTLNGTPGNRPKQKPNACEADDTTTAELPLRPSFLHQFTKVPSALASALVDGARALCILLFVNPRENLAGASQAFPETSVTELSDLCKPALVVVVVPAKDSVLETQAEQAESNEDNVSSFSGEQDEQSQRTLGTPRPEIASPARPLQLEQRGWRTWRATRKLAPWTLESQWKQRKAESEAQ